jgi:POT family proton-dependent oligopeptide transporter
MSGRAFFGHPAGLSTLFFTELWERFSFYGMRGLLILYMTAPLAAGGLAFDTAHAGAIYGMYAGSVYLACLPGGWIADRFIGPRRATWWGGVLIFAGHVCLALPTSRTFFVGLTLIVLGTGLLKPNISTMVGQLYVGDEARRDAGYSIYYMGINLGAFLAPLACGWLALSTESREWLAGLGLAPSHVWHVGFGAAAVGMGFGLVQYRRGADRLSPASRGRRPAGRRQGARRADRGPGARGPGPARRRHRTGPRLAQRRCAQRRLRAGARRGHGRVLLDDCCAAPTGRSRSGSGS